jgi:hypothetical protein
MPAPKCLTCGSFLSKQWGKDAAGLPRRRDEWQCPRHGTLLTCAQCCPRCPKTGHGGSHLRGRVAAAAAAAAAVPAAPVPSAAAAAAEAQSVMPRSRSPRRLRMTAGALEERLRRQHRFLAGRSEWPLEASWKYGSRASTWGEAVNEPFTDWWMAKLEAGTLRSVKLQIFLRWVQQQRLQQQQQQPQNALPQQQQASATGSSSSHGSDFTIPPCVACMDSLPTQLCNPCGHLCLCETCSLQLYKEESPHCPVCRGQLESFTTVWY